MKLYHYITKGNSALKEGILSFANNPNANLGYYEKRSGENTHEGIIQWMENCFEGRSRGIRAFSEPIKWTENSLSLKKFIDNADMFSIDLDALERDGLIEAIYCSPSLSVDETAPPQKGIGVSGIDETLEKMSNIRDIDYSPVNWGVCNDEFGRRFAFVPYYVIVIKGGIIPPQYITKI